jgi:SAM-dependent methyltransferase
VYNRTMNDALAVQKSEGSNGDGSFKFASDRYLTSKRTVDDRALNRRVWQCLVSNLALVATSDKIRVLDIGAGTGEMIGRMTEWRLFDPLVTAQARSGAPVQILVTAVDSDRTAILEGVRQLPLRLHELGFITAVNQDGEIIASSDRLSLKVHFVEEDVFRFAAREARADMKWDLISACAFLDLTDLSRSLPALSELLSTNGLAYFSINFDGETCLMPEVDGALDQLIIKRYHATMDARVREGLPSGDSHAGRRLFHLLRALGLRVLDLGTSDWTVFPQADGRYPNDEAYFLHCIIATIDEALRSDMDDSFRRWVGTRHRQIDEGELLYVTHQLDVLAQNSEH